MSIAQNSAQSATYDSPYGAASPSAIIDCDIHNEVPSIAALFPYLSDHWCDYIRETGFGGPGANDYPSGAPTSTRPDSVPVDNGPAGSSLQLVREQVLEPWATEVGILTCSYRVQSIHSDDLSVALAAAVNQWQLDHWRDQGFDNFVVKDPKFMRSQVDSALMRGFFSDLHARCAVVAAFEPNKPLFLEREIAIYRCGPG